MSSSHKRQHTVPQGYLRHWARPDNQLNVFDVKDGRSYSTSVANVAVESHFYTVCGEDSTTEQAFAGFEAIVISAIRQVLVRVNRMVDGEWALVPHAVSSEHKPPLAYAIAFQFARTAATRRFIGLPDEDQARRAHIDLLTAGGVEDIARMLLDYTWIVGINGTAVPVWTSDSPVVAYARPDDDSKAEPAPVAQIVYPLSPRCLLWLWHPETNPEKVAYDGHAVVADQDDVAEANTRQSVMATRHVVSASTDFTIARAIFSAR